MSKGCEHYSMSTMFESCEEQFVRLPPHATLRGMGESGATWNFSFWPWSSSECAHCYNRNGLDGVRHAGVLDLVAGFPPAGLSLAVFGPSLLFWMPNSVSSLL